MSEVLLFSGTFEGREMAQILSENQISSTVCVATEYGESVMPQLPYVTLHKGRLDEQEMLQMMKEGAFRLVVDATHPYATIVSVSVQQAAEQAGLPYIRLKRDTSFRQVKETSQEQEDEAKQKVEWDGVYVADTKECIRFLKTTSGKILLTTGSKDLKYYCEEESLKNRLVVRVLPGLESIRICEENGIKGKQIIAMQGPFSLELNKALLRDLDIQYLVTKETGSTGGFLEKMQAAREENVCSVVIGNPEKGEGFSRMQTCHMIAKTLSKTIANKVSLVGIGMGGMESLTIGALHRIEEADVIFGAKRLLESTAKIKKKPYVQEYPYYLAEEILPKMEELSNCGAKIVVLFSGDSGFYSGCKKMQDAFGDRKDCQVEILPGISSVSYMASKTGLSYESALVTSVHGAGGVEVWKEKMLLALSLNERVITLTSGKRDVEDLVKLMARENLTEYDFYIGYNLSYDTEKITKVPITETFSLQKEGLYICYIVNKGKKIGIDSNGMKLTPGMKDEAFIRDKVPMTKEEIREISICKLGLTKDSVCYDIGSGTGSIAVEIAKLGEKIDVYAIEQKEEAIALLKKNKEKHKVSNMHIIEGSAPDALQTLPAPTHAFIGGSSGQLTQILEVLYQKNPHMNVVINAVSLETIAQLTKLKSDERIEQLELVQVQVSGIRTIGSYQMMQAQNPVMICSFQFGGNV